MFPEKCFKGGCRNKVRVWIPAFEKHPAKVVKTPSCVKHADEAQAGLLGVHASLVWALNRIPGSPDV